MKVSIRQLEMLISYLEQHKDLARGRVRGKEGSQLSARLWESCAEMLNSEFPGAKKTGNEWKKYYNVYKSRTTGKEIKIRNGFKSTGGGPPEAVSLTPLEERLCAVLRSPRGRKQPLCRHNPLERACGTEETIHNEAIPIAMVTEEAPEEEDTEEVVVVQIIEDQPKDAVDVGPSLELNLSEVHNGEDKEKKDKEQRHRRRSHPSSNPTESINSAFELAAQSLRTMEQQRINADRRLAEVVAEHAAAMARHAEAMQEIAYQFRRFVDIYAEKAGSL